MITVERMGKTSRSGWGRLATVALLLLVLGIAGIELANPHSYFSEAVGRIGEATAGHDANVTDLSSVTQLQARFNADEGRTRLILLFSPT